MCGLASTNSLVTYSENFEYFNMLMFGLLNLLSLVLPLAGEVTYDLVIYEEQFNVVKHALF